MTNQLKPFSEKMSSAILLNILLIVYTVLRCGYFKHCIEIWESSLRSHLDPLVQIQKKCIGNISFSKYLAPSEPLFQKLNHLNFEQLVIQRISLIMFKYRIGVLPLPVSALFQYNSVIHTHNTRRSKFIQTPIDRSEATYRTFLGVVLIFGIISLKMFLQMYHTPVLDCPLNLNFVVLRILDFKYKLLLYYFKNLV